MIHGLRYDLKFAAINYGWFHEFILDNLVRLWYMDALLKKSITTTRNYFLLKTLGLV